MMKSRAGLCIALMLVSLAALAVCCRPANPPQMTQKSATPLLLLGIDGAAWKFMQPLLERGALPNFAELIRTGTHGYLETLLPTQSVIIWNSIVTGCLPEKHGITGWLSGAGDQLAISSSMRRQPALWDIATHYNMRGLYVNWWTTWPVTPVNGILMSHFLFYPSTPDRVYPQSVSAIVDNIIARERASFSNRRTAASNEIGLSPQAENDDILVSLTEEFCRRERFDTIALYLRGTDIIEHEHYHSIFPHEFDPTATVDPQRPTWIPDYYRLVDEWIGRLQRLFPHGVNVVIVSDHGMEAITGQHPPIATLVFNRLLQDMGYASIRDEYSLEWDKTLVFQYDYHLPGVIRRARLNLVGREESGRIPVNEFVTRRLEISDRLRSLMVERQADSMKVPLFTSVVVTEGEESDLTCHLNVEIQPVDMLVLGDEKFRMDKYLTHFISHTSGQHDHAPPGVIICSGPAFREGVTLEGARVIDILPTIAAVNGWAIAETWDGIVLRDALKPEYPGVGFPRVKAYPMPIIAEGDRDAKEKQRPPKEVEDDLRNNLKSLGYIQ